MSISRFRITQTPSNSPSNTPEVSPSGTSCPIPTPTNTVTPTNTATMTPTPTSTFCYNPQAYTIFDSNSDRFNLRDWMISQGSSWRGFNSVPSNPSTTQSIFEAQMNAYISYTGFTAAKNNALMAEPVSNNEDPITITNTNSWSGDFTWVSIIAPVCPLCPEGEFDYISDISTNYLANNTYKSMVFYYSGNAITQGYYRFYTSFSDTGMRRNTSQSQYQVNTLVCLPTPTPSPTNTLTPTITPTQTQTNTSTPTITPTNTNTNTATQTITPTNTNTNTATQTITPTNTNTSTVTPTNTPTRTSVLPSGLQIYYDASNTTSYSGGTTWYDLTVNGRNATLFNNPTFDSGNGGSIYTDGVNQWGLTSYSGSPTDSYTYSVWFKNDNYSELKVPFGRGRDGFGGWSLQLSVATNGRAAAGAVTTIPTSTGFTVNGTTLMALNTWYYITGVWDAGQSLKIYVNGVLEGTVNTTRTSLRTSTQGWWWSSINGTTFTSGFNAVAQVYNRALTQAEIQQNYNASESRFINPIPTPTVTRTPTSTPTLTPTNTNTPSSTISGCQQIFLYPNNINACDHSGSLTQYETNNSLTPTRFWILNECGITPVSGGNLWFSQGPGATSYQVDNGGFVINTFSCP